MTSIKHIPSPYFELDASFRITASSKRAALLFGETTSFLELLDEGSLPKASRFLSERNNGIIELNMHTLVHPHLLHTVHIDWVEGTAHILCMPKDNQLNELIRKVDEQGIRLAETDFKLFEKKEDLEQSIETIKRLSAPFIKMTSELAFVPLFGQLDSDLITQNQEGILQRIFQFDYESLLFDFSGVSNVTVNGTDAFLQLLLSLKSMGVQPEVVGLKPEHAKFLKGRDLNQHALVNGSLSEVLQKRMQKRI